ncbi:hypothetical protein M422DRAFT_78014, partial [Sphaerobolus stellatus SS14]
REPNQRAAHMILFTTNPGAANRLMRDGVRIAQTLLWARKLFKEPSRCLKCQKMGTGHFASSCPEKEECCGTCGAAHRTKDCPVTHKEGRYCANCKLSGHAAWDRGCPAFASNFDKLTARIPDNQFKFYPIVGETASWER